MNFIESIEKYLETVSESSYESYRLKIFMFHEFLETKKAINNHTYSTYLKAISFDELIESFEYYFEENNISSKSIAYHYAAVLKRYFDWLYQNGIKNSRLIESFGLNRNNEDSYQYKIDKYIKTHPRLNELNTKEELSYDDVEILVYECDIILSKGNNSNDIIYNDYLFAIIIKLIIFSGIMYRTLRQIKLADFNDKHNTLKINGITIHLPNNMSVQISNYVQNIRTNHESEYLFVKANGKQLNDQTKQLSEILNSIIGRKDVTGLIKFSIIEMIKVGINQSIIMDFTSAGKVIYDYCQDVVNGEKSVNRNRYLDSKMRSLKMFDYL